ncbi:hypothetical protein IMZ11_33670 [Microtetraspora sp. AC03309]|uniref:hypothetical protein n=1 Tax=Microtetraspora sp. AC03309 TaxID=2779376 RepID=UPI001E2EE771|nr:hypothetical protein [Microtetraspora sp. AC03309]MCC5580578.1 hypothetical protein [Microtetraspora sp. AC03309]
MAVTKSGLYVPTWMDMLDTSDLDIDLDATTHKVAMFNNSVTPNFSSDTAYGSAPYNANEVSGTGYTAGGTLLPSPTLTESPAGTLKWNSGNIDWATSTITAARAALIYADALLDQAIALINFGADYSTVSGLFRIQPHANGLVTIQIVP